jgi:hypothetical protein
MFSSKISVFGTEWLFRFCMRRQIDLVAASGNWFVRKDKFMV